MLLSITSNCCLAILICLLVAQISIVKSTDDFLPLFQQDESVRFEKSNNILAYMNQSESQCDDFYTYACGNWQSAKHMSQQQTMTLEVDKALQNMLESTISLEDDVAAQKMKQFYQSCLTAEKNGPLQQAFFSDLIKSHGGFPAAPASNWLQFHTDDYNWQHVVAKLRYNYGLSILIGFEIDINQLSEDENSLYLMQPDTIIPARLCNMETCKHLSITALEFQNIQKDIAHNLQIWLTIKSSEAQQVAAQIINFEYSLCHGIGNEDEFLVQYQNFYPYTKRKTLADLTIQFNNSIDFEAFTSTSFGSTLHKPVFMSTPVYYKHLIETINQFNKTILANYIMYRALSALSFPQHTTDTYCLALIKRHFSKTIGHMYQRKYADTMKSDAVESIFYRLKSVMQQILRQTDWMEQDTRRAAIDRLAELTLRFPNYEAKQQIELKIDIHNYWKNYALLLAQVQTDNLKKLRSIGIPEPKQEIEAYDLQLQYRRVHKRIDIGWGLLQAPHYQKIYPYALHFATIGYKLAHELVKVFDDSNWTTNTLSHYFWDPRTARAYNLRMDCYRQQISNYFYENPQTFSNITFVRELITSSGALSVAFRAYLDWLLYMSPHNDLAILSKETLPHMNFSNTQLFFIIFAQSFCQTSSVDTAKPVFSVSQHHTTERLRVNGPLANNAEFSKEFACAAGAQMNPVDKCMFYK